MLLWFRQKGLAGSEKLSLTRKLLFVPIPPAKSGDLAKGFGHACLDWSGRLSRYFLSSA
jgi:hypothetical protein